jgi:hypothetical protein
VVDTSGLDAFTDPKKKEFMLKFVIPVAVEILESRLKVTSNSIIPAFNASQAGCDDDGKLTVDSKYATNTTQGDFLLLIGALNETSSGTLAYATYCVLGKRMFWKLIERSK